MSDYVDPFEKAGEANPPAAASQPEDSPAPAVDKAIAEGVHAQDVRMAWEGMPLDGISSNTPRLSIELGLGNARGIRARMLSHLPPYESGVSEEEYVAHQVAVTKSQMDRGLLTDHDGLRLQRSAGYAQLRYRQFMQGQVASL